MDLALADLNHWWMYSSSVAGMGRHTGMSKLLCHEQNFMSKCNFTSNIYCGRL